MNIIHKYLLKIWTLYIKTNVIYQTNVKSKYHAAATDVYSCADTRECIIISLLHSSEIRTTCGRQRFHQKYFSDSNKNAWNVSITLNSRLLLKHCCSSESNRIKGIIILNQKGKDRTFFLESEIRKKKKTFLRGTKESLRRGIHSDLTTNMLSWKYGICLWPFERLSYIRWSSG